MKSKESIKELWANPIHSQKMKHIEIRQTKKALKGYTKSFYIKIKNISPLIQLNETRKGIGDVVKTELTLMKGLKFNEMLHVSFMKLKVDPKTKSIDEETKDAYFNCKAKTIINETEIDQSLKSSSEEILKTISVWLSEGSGWRIDSIISHYINIVKYKPMKGSSYIELPQELRHNKKGLINIKNEDNDCFRLCHIRQLNPQDKDPQRIKKLDKKYINRLDYAGIEFPVNVKQYNQIEKQNDININVFGYKNKQPYPIYVSKEKYDKHMNLLLTEDKNKHYVLIKDFNRFMFNQTKYEGKKHFCMYCLQCFSSERVLNNHKDNCIQVNGTQAVKMPGKDNDILKFNNSHKEQPVPFVIYTDFEAITEKISSCKANNNESYTAAYQKHTDCGYGYKVVCCYNDEYSKTAKTYRGEKAVYKFMAAILDEVKYCKEAIKKGLKKLILTEEERDDWHNANKCHICNKEYTDKDYDDVQICADYCIMTGKYLGSAHKKCHIEQRPNPEEVKIPVIFHNLRGYDSHFIMQEIGEIVKKHTYKNKER